MTLTWHPLLGLAADAPPGEDARELLRSRARRHIESLRGGRAVRVLKISAADVCNLACPYCIHAPACEGTAASRPGRMSAEVARRAADAFLSHVAAHGHASATISIEGGEPLLNREVVLDMIAHCRETCPPAIDLRIVLNTNGTLLGEETAVFLRDHRVLIALSLDGLEETNDRLRVFPSGKGTFRTVLSKIDLLERIGHPLTGISATITRESSRTFGREVVDFAAARGMKWLRYDPDVEDMSGADPDAIADLLVALWVYGTERGLEIAGYWPRPALNLAASARGVDTVAFCLAGRGEVVAVDTAGAIVPCTHSGVCFGTIDRGLSEALRPGGAYERYVSENIAGGVPACEGCEIEGACAGGCCVAREHRDGLEATVCAIYRESTRRLLPILLERSL